MNTILIISEEEKFFKSVESNLRKIMSIRIKTYNNTLDMIEFYLRNYADIIILDIDFVKNKIKKLVDVLRSIKRETKILLILSEENISYVADILQLGIISYQIKPLNLSNICNLLELNLKVSSKYTQGGTYD